MVFPWLIGLVFHSKDLGPEIIITSIREEFIITSYNLGNLNYFIILRMNSLIFYLDRAVINQMHLEKENCTF
jgi:hypothetical protein